MPSIAVLGSLNMDVVAIAPRIPVPGETIIGTQYLTEPGGKGANQAYAIAKLGGQVSMIGRIGEDDFGRRMRDNLANVGCDIPGVKTVSGASGVAVIFVSETGQNSIIVVPGANAHFFPEDLEADLERIEHAEILLLQLEIPIATVHAAAEQAKSSGTRVILDPAPATSLPEGLCKSIDILTPNETEASILAGIPPASLNPESAEKIAKQLQALGPPVVIMKLGEQGCLLMEPTRSTLIPALSVAAVDTTAAGDIFNAALAVALSEDRELVEACRFAVNASALSVTRIGAQASVPSRKEVDEFALAATQMRPGLR